MALKNRFERIARGQGARPLGFSPLDTGVIEPPRFLQVSPEVIECDHSQPRKNVGELEGLRASIREHGILQPLIVTALDDQRYLLVAGERRLTAARELGLREVPVLVRSVQEQRRLVLQIVENLHRKDLLPLEEADGIRRLIDESGLSQREAAEQLGKSLTYVNELLRMLQLPADVLEAVRTSEQPVSKSLLLEITKQPGEERQRTLWQRFASGTGLTVKQARENKRARVTATPGKAAEERGTAVWTAPSSLPNGAAVWTLRTETGLVIVQLTGDVADRKAHLRQTLQEALRLARIGQGTRLP